MAVWVAASSASRAARSAYRDLFTRVAGPCALEIAAPDQSGFDPAFASRLTKIPGVVAVLPRILTSSALVSDSGAEPVLVLGLENASALNRAGLTVAAGEPFGMGGVWLDRNLAAALASQPGQTASLWTPSGLQSESIRGLIQGSGAAGSLPIVCISLESAQRLFRLPGRVNSLQIVLCEDADAQVVADQLRPCLPVGLSVQAPAARGDSATATLRSATLGLDALALVALAVAAFVMLNTYLLSLNERRRQLALLNVLGATRGQIRWLLLREAVILGMAGGILGLLAGLLLEHILVALVARCWGMEPPRRTTAVATLLLGVLVGPGVSLAAALVALRQAVPIAPLEEMGDRRAVPSCRPPRGPILLGLSLVGVACLLLTVGYILAVPHGPIASLIAPAVVVGLIGCVLALPLWMRTALTGVSRLLLGCVPPECEFALHQMRRRLPRTYLTAGVFFVTVATAVLFAHSLENTLADLQLWYRRTIVADFLIRGAAPDTGLLLAAPLPEQLASELAHVEGVAQVDKISFLPGRAGGESVLFLPRTFASANPPLDLREGDAANLRQHLEAGEAAIGAALAHRLGLHPGDWLTVENRAGPQRVRVGATVNEYAAGGMVVYLEWAAAHRLLDFEGVHVFLVSLAGNSPRSSSEPLRQFCAAKGLLLQTNAELRDEVTLLVQRVSILLWVLIALAFLVAAFGILNTLALIFQEQEHDLNILRLLGMTEKRRKLALVYQGMALATLSSWPAVAAGTGFAYLLNIAVSRSLGIDAAFHFRPLETCGCFVVALFIGSLTGFFRPRKRTDLAVHGCRSSY